jgi:hypothetical protein
MKKQNGGGFTFDQKDVMGGQMARVSYSDCDSPTYYNKFQVYDVQNGGSKKSQKKIVKSKSQNKNNKSKSQKKNTKTKSKSKSKSKSQSKSKSRRK